MRVPGKTEIFQELKMLPSRGWISLLFCLEREDEKRLSVCHGSIV